MLVLYSQYYCLATIDRIQFYNCIEKQDILKLWETT
jgi:hypothetical protein